MISESDTLEDYLLNPVVLDRATTSQLLATGRKPPEDFCPESAEILDSVHARFVTKDPKRITAREILDFFRQEVNERFLVSFTDSRIAECFLAEDLPPKLIQLLFKLDTFSRGF